MDRRFVVPELLYNPPCGYPPCGYPPCGYPPCGFTPGLEYWGGGANVVLTWPHFGHGENFDGNGPPHPPQNPPDWGGGANVVLTWPHFGHGENFDANTVPQLPQNAPPLVPPDDCDLFGVPHDGQEDEVGDRIVLQLVQVSDTTHFTINLT